MNETVTYALFDVPRGFVDSAVFQLFCNSGGTRQVTLVIVCSSLKVSLRLSCKEVFIVRRLWFLQESSSTEPKPPPPNKVIQPPTQCRRPQSKGTKPSKLGSLSFYLSRGHRASSKPACIAQGIGWSYAGKIALWNEFSTPMHNRTPRKYTMLMCFTTSINTSHSGPTFSQCINSKSSIPGLASISSYYPTALRRVQITPKRSTNITLYLYSRGTVRQVFSQRASDELD